MNYIGIDIGSTATKVAVYDGLKFIHKFTLPTGFSGVEVARDVLEKIQEFTPFLVTATGYGRVSVEYANQTLTEILCHGVGANYIFKDDCTVIDVGGQDTKAIRIVDSRVDDFLMNDKCSAGTGKFIEVMATRLGLSLTEIYSIATKNSDVHLSSTCTVFAESEIISLIANGLSQGEIAYAIIESSAKKVSTLASRLPSKNYFLSGGLSKVPLFLELLGSSLDTKIHTDEDAIYCGAMGAAIMGAKKLDK